MARSLNLRDLFRQYVSQSLPQAVLRQLRTRRLPAPQPPPALTPWLRLTPNNQQQWRVWLQVDLTDRVVSLLVMAWLDRYARWLNPPAQTASAKPKPPEEDTEAGVPELTVEELVAMMEEASNWFAHCTHNPDVGQLRADVIHASEPAGKDDENADPGVYAYPGVIGVNYGTYCVYFRKGKVGFFPYKKSSNPEEHLCTDDVHLSMARGWARRTRVEEARKIFLKRRQERVSKA